MTLDLDAQTQRLCFQCQMFNNTTSKFVSISMHWNSYSICWFSALAHLKSNSNPDPSNIRSRNHSPTRAAILITEMQIRVRTCCMYFKHITYRADGKEGLCKRFTPAHTHTPPIRIANRVSLSSFARICLCRLPKGLTHLHLITSSGAAPRDQIHYAPCWGDWLLGRPNSRCNIRALGNSIHVGIWLGTNQHRRMDTHTKWRIDGRPRSVSQGCFDVPTRTHSPKHTNIRSAGTPHGSPINIPIRYWAESHRVLFEFVYYWMMTLASNWNCVHTHTRTHVHELILN